MKIASEPFGINSGSLNPPQLKRNYNVDQNNLLMIEEAREDDEMYESVHQGSGLHIQNIHSN